jgi:phosphatidylinositol glycan class N
MRHVYSFGMFTGALKIIDDGIKATVKNFEDYWKHDGRTTYIFTADHGMTNWGSHGAGTQDETETPFVAWGAGIRSAKTRGTNDPIIPRVMRCF